MSYHPLGQNEDALEEEISYVTMKSFFFVQLETPQRDNMTVKEYIEKYNKLIVQSGVEGDYK